MKTIFKTSLAVLAAIAFFQSISVQAFDDVFDQHINGEAIDFLQADNVVQGYEDGTFKPENRINRAEFVKIIVASQVDTPTGANCFNDVKAEWFAPYICTAKKLGYISGYPDGSFRPGDYINFAEASKIISESLKVEPDAEGTNGEWFAGYVNALAEKKAIPSTVSFFDKDVSRGEMSEIIWRLETDKTDKVSQDYKSITEAFPALQSCDALKEKFDVYQSFDYGYPLMMRSDMVFEETSLDSVMTEGAAAPSMAMKAGGSVESVVADDFSSTNIQVEGVDEADIIKNDGKYIYLVKGDTVRIVEAFPPSVMKQVSELTFGDEDFTPRELYVNGDQLVVIGSQYPNYGLMKRMIYPRPWRGNETKVYTLDISDHSKPVQTRVVSFDGDYNTSRRIGNDLYMVMNSTPNVWLLDEIKSGEDLLPQMKDGTKASEPMVGCSDIRYFPGAIRPNYLVVASIPLASPTSKIDRDVFIGSSENVYASSNNLYVAANEVNYDYYTDWDWRTDTAHTLVYQFALKDGQAEFSHRGRVPGTILNQFSMDEYNQHFRVATTTNSWGSDTPSSNNLYVLDDAMNTVGKIEEIAPGERIYSTRFLGDRLYMVTFEQVDPLFVIDLSDAENPVILGKLKIPGFSDYLHPYDATHIIGFGKDTEVNKYGNVLAKGFKMALFDVSDVANPVQQFAEYIGDRGTDSELLRNHKALLFDKEKELLAFPIQINELVSPEALECNQYRYDTCPALCQTRCIPTSCTEDENGKAICTEDCGGLGSCTAPSYERYTTTFSGALVYTLNLKDGFTERGRLTHYDDQDILKMGDYWPYDYKKTIQRILYIGDYLYSVSQDMIKTNTLKTVEDVSSLTLE